MTNNYYDSCHKCGIFIPENIEEKHHVRTYDGHGAKPICKNCLEKWMMKVD